MKKTIFMILFASLVTLGLATDSHAERVTMDDAKKAAEHWIIFIIAKKGSWGGAESASVKEIRELRRKGRKIGYFTEVRPKGYIVLPLRKELAPIKAYSAVSDMDPDKETGMADLIKGRMAETIKGIEKRLGALDRVPTKALQKILLKDHRKSWDKLIGEQGDMTFEEFSENVVTMNYEGGEEWLLSSYWSQIAPYNLQCPVPLPPALPCSGPVLRDHPMAGCVAIAGAQVIRYWNWPPRRRSGLIPYAGEPYDWPSMLDIVKTNSDQASIDAVADLVANVGDLVDMDYGCDGSSADTRDMENAFDFMGYHESGGPISRWVLSAPLYTPREWFELMKEQLNQNRPLQYRIPGDPGHSVVVDGWQEDLVGVMQYHMNNGHGPNDPDTAWFTLDEDLFSGQGELMFVNVRPETSLEGTISGTYEKQDILPEVRLPYYVDQDATGHSAVFEPGVLLQFLGGVTVTNTSTVGGTFRFEGGPFDRTLLFADGDQTKGIKINNGAMVLSQNGTIKLHKIPRPGP